MFRVGENDKYEWVKTAWNPLSKMPTDRQLFPKWTDSSGPLAFCYPGNNTSKATQIKIAPVLSRNSKAGNRKTAIPWYPMSQASISKYTTCLCHCRARVCYVIIMLWHGKDPLRDTPACVYLINCVYSQCFITVFFWSDVAPHSVPVVELSRGGALLWVPATALHGRPIDYRHWMGCHGGHWKKWKVEHWLPCHEEMSLDPSIQFVLYRVLLPVSDKAAHLSSFIILIASTLPSMHCKTFVNWIISFLVRSLKHIFFVL